MFLFGWSVACVFLSSLLQPAWTRPLIAERYATSLLPPWPPKYPHFTPHYANSTPSYEKRNLKTIQSIYNLTIYPNQIPIILTGAAGVPAGLFNQNATGRVDPVGNFSGFEDSIEYFFALAPVPQLYPAAPAITRAKITEFTSSCPEVAASVVYLFQNVTDSSSPNNGKALAPLKQVAFWRFDSTGAVLAYDAWIPNLNSWVRASLGIDITNTTQEAASIETLCARTQTLCTGNNTQWSSEEQCVEMLSQKPYGNYDEAWGDNIVCRTIHLVLTIVRPDVHCPHVGETGGNKCVDVAYPEDYFSDEALYGDPLGGTFTCPRH